MMLRIVENSSVFARLTSCLQLKVSFQCFCSVLAGFVTLCLDFVKYLAYDLLQNLFCLMMVIGFFGLIETIGNLPSNL